MDSVVQQNAANAEESASAAEELSGQANEMQTSIQRFHLSSNRQRESTRGNKGRVGLTAKPGKSSAKTDGRAKPDVRQIIPLENEESILREF